ncbi:MAG TPA: MarR family transcriptional regulator [Deinococcales bacterium]|nr:MarR family transcriptional regulator [Deinococcales bacterium]
MLSDHDQVIEDFGLWYEGYGLPRTLGRMFALLLLADEPRLSLDEIAARLNVSKASASTGARQLVTFGFIEKTTVPGDRRDYYRMSQSGQESQLRAGIKKLLSLTMLLGKAAAIPDLGPEARERITGIHGMYASLEKHFESFFEQYSASRGAGKD